MQRYVLSLAVGIAFCATAVAVQAQQCPVENVRAAVDQACPCGSVRNHGQYMKCVRAQINKLKASGCNVSPAMHCAEMSTCGRPQSPVVCCSRKGRPQILTAAKCSSQHGTAVANVASICDAACATSPPAP